MLIALSVQSQPYRLLPVAVTKAKCGLVIDSTALYNIAENNRLALDCFQDSFTRDSIINSQQTTIAMQHKEYERLLRINIENREDLDKLSNSLTLEKPKKYRWAAIGAGIGFVLALLL